MLDSRNFYVAGKAAWTTGITTVGSDDWEVEQERLAKIARVNGVTYVFTPDHSTVVWGGDGVPNQYGVKVYFGLDKDGYVSFWTSADLIAANRVAKFTSCTEGGPASPLNCVETPGYTDPNGNGHRP